MSVKLPFFSISRHIADAPAPIECPGASCHALAFTTLIDAGSYLQVEHLPDIEVNLIYRKSLAQYLDGSEQAGLLGVGFDPKPDGSVTPFSIAELRTMFAA